MAKEKLGNGAGINSLSAGRHSDGGNLYLNITKSGARSWLFMFTLPKQKRREMGLGNYPDISLARARQIAAKHRADLAQGVDPIRKRNKARQAERDKNITFKQAVDMFLEREAFTAPLTPKTIYKWTHCLNQHAESLHHLILEDIETQDVLACLEKIWFTKPETAARTRIYIEKVLAWATVRKLRSGPNPALLAGNLDVELPKQADFRETKNHASLDWRFVPPFVKDLQAREAIAARLLEFIVLTGLRSGEARGATWSEYDPKAKLLTIPVERMKTRKKNKNPHIVPLSDRAVAIIEEMRKAPLSNLIFTNPNNLREFSVNAPTMLLRRMKRGNVTVHGFRASFKTWAAENTNHSRAAVELCLAHMVGNDVERAYMRGPMLEKRRAVMNDWQDYCLGKHKPENLIEIPAQEGQGG